jgi:hypothetical protein
VQTALMNVRFEGNNGHDADVMRCLLLTQSGHWVGKEQEAIAYFRKAFEIDSALETARDNLKLLGATLERQPFDRQTKPKN